MCCMGLCRSLGMNGDLVQDGGKYTNMFLCVLIRNILVVNKCVFIVEFENIIHMSRKKS